jgi:hypothetical protein
MIRHSFKLLLVALVAAFALASPAEAAGKKAVRHRVKHSSRVHTGATATTSTRKAGPKRRVRKSTTRKSTGKRAVKHSARPATKPR